MAAVMLPETVEAEVVVGPPLTRGKMRNKPQIKNKRQTAKNMWMLW